MSKSLELPVEENEKPIFFVLPRFERDQLHNRDIEKFSLSCMGYFQRDPAIVYRRNRAIPIPPSSSMSCCDENPGNCLGDVTMISKATISGNTNPFPQSRTA